MVEKSREICDKVHGTSVLLNLRKQIGREELEIDVRILFGLIPVLIFFGIIPILDNQIFCLDIRSFFYSVNSTLEPSVLGW